MSRLATSSAPVLFDVDANVGQTIKNFRHYFKRSTIHGFKRGPSTFEMLREQTPGIQGFI
jgi:hypothetical protein